MKTELDTRALLNVKEMCEYLGIGQTKARELLSNPANGLKCYNKDTDPDGFMHLPDGEELPFE